MGLGADPTTSSPNDIQHVANPGSHSDLSAGLLVGGLGALVLGGLLFAIAAPFALGAAGAAIATRSGDRKEAAKKGAIYGGLIGIGANLALSALSATLQAATGNRNIHVYGAGLVPLGVGLYIGYKRR